MPIRTSAPGGGHPEFERVQTGDEGVFFINGTLSVRMRCGMELGKGCLPVVCVSLACVAIVWASPTTYGGWQAFMDNATCILTADSCLSCPASSACGVSSGRCSNEVSSLGTIRVGFRQWASGDGCRTRESVEHVMARIEGPLPVTEVWARSCPSLGGVPRGDCPC
jgi:hypothetical protein